MTFETVRLDHFAIAADDTTAMAAWYQKVLGLEVVAQRDPVPPDEQIVYMIAPRSRDPKVQGVHFGMMIEVMPRNKTARHVRNSHEPGLSHVAWCVSDFDAALAHLKACEVKITSGILQAIGGWRIICFEDCEGNMTQIVERVSG
jgi:catechol 2,3-dioxygenase-like lactoylglutathione lyase family enzyme